MYILIPGCFSEIPSFPAFILRSPSSPHHGGVKFQTVALSILCAMFQEQLPSFRECNDCFSGIISRYFLFFSYNFICPLDCLHYDSFHIPYSLNFNTQNFIFKFLFSLLLYYIPILLILFFVVHVKESALLSPGIFLNIPYKSGKIYYTSIFSISYHRI
jgi:hypothetical protein